MVLCGVVWCATGDIGARYSNDRYLRMVAGMACRHTIRCCAIGAKTTWEPPAVVCLDRSWQVWCVLHAQLSPIPVASPTGAGLQLSRLPGPLLELAAAGAAPVCCPPSLAAASLIFLPSAYNTNAAAQVC